MVYDGKCYGQIDVLGGNVGKTTINHPYVIMVLWYFYFRKPAKISPIFLSIFTLEFVIQNLESCVVAGIQALQISPRIRGMQPEMELSEAANR
jgi:hypothetical protein